MNLVLTYCWREWRAQQGVLLGYLGLGLTALCLVFTLVPEHFWLEEGRRALALSWFVALGGIGVLAFVAPTLVRGEYGVKDDQFVRRLPGALVPSFGGKLLFLLLATLALPLLALSAGELFLLGNGQGWHDLFRSDHGGSVCIDWPWPVVWLGYAALLIPWVWAIGTWLPSGRMALGGTLLLVLLVGVAVAAVLRQYPGLERGIAWQAWLAAVPGVGVGVAGVSWALGRRGGGALRSARFGLLTTLLALLAPAAWLAERVQDYTHPDPQRLVHLRVDGLTPDLRYALVKGQAHTEYLFSLPFRVDLHTGSAVQLGGLCTALSPEVLRPAQLGLRQQSRFWGCYEYDMWEERIVRYRVLDLATLQDIATSAAATPEAMRSEIEPRLRSLLPSAAAATTLRAPGGIPVWFEAGQLCFQVAPGQIERQAWQGALPRTWSPAGHGFRTYGGEQTWFDLTSRTAARIEDEHDNGWFVRGVQLRRQRSVSGAWLRRDAGETEARPVPELEHADVFGLLDDDRVLCRRYVAKQDRIFTWNPSTGAVEPVALPFPCRGHGTQALAPFHQFGSLLPRDPAGRVWLLASMAAGSQECFLRLDPATLQSTVVPGTFERLEFQLLGWPDADSALIQERATIQRLDVTSGARTQLFPRQD